MTTIALMICVNDPDNGLDTGRVDGIDLWHDGILMEVRGEPLDCRTVQGDADKPHSLKIGDVTVPILSYQTWVGNWCWDSARVKLEDAARVINYCRQNNWACEAGALSLYDLFDAGQELTAADLEKAMQPDEKSAP